MNRFISGRSFLIFAAIAFALAACKRDEIVSVDPEKAPRETAQTIEVLLNTSLLANWTDTVFSGFSGPSRATSILVQEGPDLFSHGLFRFDNILDSVFIPDTFSVILRYDSAKVVIPVDTSGSILGSDGTTVQLRLVDENWDDRTADWVFAIDSLGEQVEWTVPGGTLGDVLEEFLVTEEIDSVVIELGERSDSLLRAWNDTTRVNPGLALVVTDTGRFSVFLPTLTYQVIPELEPDTAIQIATFATERTYVFDPEAGDAPPGVLRVGGVDSYRIYTELILPDSFVITGGAGTVSIAGAQISRAELVLRSLRPPDPPFRAEKPFVVIGHRIADDFGVLGPKTPLAGIVDDSEATIDPDSLEEGSLVLINLSERLQQLADSLDRFDVLRPPPIRISIRAVPEGVTFGFWEFGSASGDPDLDPIVRIIFTPPTDFGVP